MAHNFRNRNNLGQFIAFGDSLSSTSSADSISLDDLHEVIDHEIDHINNFNNLHLVFGQNRTQIQNNIPVPLPIMAFNLNPYNGDLNPSTNDGLKLFLKATEERKEDAKLKIS